MVGNRPDASRDRPFPRGGESGYRRACGWGPVVRARSTGSRSSPGVKNRGTSVRVHRGVRRPDGHDGGDHRDVAAGHPPDMRHPLAAQSRFGTPRVRTGRRSLRICDRCTRRRRQALARARLEENAREVGSEVPGDHQAVGVGVGARSLRSAKFDVEIRTVITTTNAIESIHLLVQASRCAHVVTSPTRLRH